MAEVVDITKKRPPGRPKGHPKSGGRKRGTPNRNTGMLRDLIHVEADPIGRLCKIAAGKKTLFGNPEDLTAKRIKRYPSAEEQMKALELLSRKVMADRRELKSEVALAVNDLRNKTEAELRRMLADREAALNNGAGAPEGET